MYLADGGGGGGATAPGPQFTGTQTLRIEPSAIPDALAAFIDAHDRVERKIQELQNVPIQAWAKDPVSGETRVQFAQRTITGGAESAMACLKGYQKQLAAAIKSLQDAKDEYTRLEGDNTAQWGKY